MKQIGRRKIKGKIQSISIYITSFVMLLGSLTGWASESSAITNTFHATSNHAEEQASSDFFNTFTIDYAKGSTKVVVTLNQEAQGEQFKTQSIPSFLDTLRDSYEAKVLETYNHLPVIVIEVPNENLSALSQLPFVKSVESEVFVKAVEYVDWGIEATNAHIAWDSSYKGSGIKVAVIDSGVDIDHEDLHVAGGASFVNYTTSYDDDDGHGTHVAGIIAAQHNNIGTKGVAPNVELYALKALNYEGVGTGTSIISAIEWSIENNIDIINLSLGSPKDSSAIKSSVDAAYNAGILVVGAAGNHGHYSSGYDEVHYPAGYDSVIAVASMNSQKAHSYFSAVYDEVEIAAPGESIASTTFDGGYGFMDGTSMATPYVTGILALYMEYYPNESIYEIRKKIASTAVDFGAPGRDPQFGYGLIQFPDTYPPDQPQNVTATESDRQVTLSWEAPSDFGVMGYNVYQDGQLVNSEIIKETTYTIDNLTNGTAYTFHVVTVDTANNVSQPSPAIVATPYDNIAPREILDLMVEKDASSVSFYYNYPADEDLHAVELYKDGLLLETINANTEDMVFFEDFETTIDKSITLSNWEIANYGGNQVIHTNIEEQDNTSATLSFDYNVMKDGIFSFDYSLFTEENYDVFNVSVDGQVVLSQSGHNNAWRTFEMPITKGLHSFTFTYTKNEKESIGYDRVALDNISIKATPTLKYVDQMVEQDVEYVYDFISVDTLGNKNKGVSVVAGALDVTPPDTPGNFVATPSDKSVTLKWDAPPNPDVVGYNIYKNGVRINTSYFKWTQYVVTGLTNGTTYSFQVEAVDKVGNVSPLTEEVFATPVDNIAPPQINDLSYDVNYKSIFFYFNYPYQEDLHVVEVIRDGQLIETLSREDQMYYFFEDFENESINSAFTNDNWKFTTNGNDGTNGFISDIAGQDNSTATLSFEYFFEKEGVLTFDSFIEIEGGHSNDHFIVEVDGRTRLRNSFSEDWTSSSIWVQGGLHKFTFKYVKDGTGSYGQDAVILDNIAINYYPLRRFIDNTTEHDKSYTYEFVSVDKAGNRSDAVSVTTPPASTPPTPVLEDVVRGENKLFVYWDSSLYDEEKHGKISYNVYVNGAKVNQQPIEGGRYTLHDLVNGEQYEVYVTIVNEGNEELSASNKIVAAPMELPTFTDIRTNYWAYDNIYWMADRKFMNGYPDGSFKPDLSLTRAQAAVVLDRVLRLKNVGTAQPDFKDTKNYWAEDAIIRIFQNGIMNGYTPTSFGPEDTITREQMAVMLHRTLGFKPLEDISNNPFKDISSNHWAYESVIVMYQHGIINGFTATQFGTGEKLTRAQMSALIQRIYEKLQ